MKARPAFHGSQYLQATSTWMGTAGTSHSTCSKLNTSFPCPQIRRRCPGSSFFPGQRGPEDHPYLFPLSHPPTSQAITVSCPSHLFNVPSVCFPSSLSLSRSWRLLYRSLGGLQQAPHLSLSLQSCPQSDLYAEAKVTLLKCKSHHIAPCVTRLLSRFQPPGSYFCPQLPCLGAFSRAVPSVRNRHSLLVWLSPTRSTDLHQDASFA